MPVSSSSCSRRRRSLHVSPRTRDRRTADPSKRLECAARGRGVGPGVAAQLQIPINQKVRLDLDAARVELDGAAADESVLVEVFARIGKLKGAASFTKVSTDTLKLIASKASSSNVRLVLAFADQEAAESVVGWRAAVLEAKPDRRRSSFRSPTPSARRSWPLRQNRKWSTRRQTKTRAGIRADLEVTGLARPRGLVCRDSTPVARAGRRTPDTYAPVIPLRAASGPTRTSASSPDPVCRATQIRGQCSQ